MKKTLLFLVLSFMAIALAAQAGLFDLAFGDDLNTADSLLCQQGFLAKEIDGSMVKYYSDFNKLVDSVVLFVDPETQIVAGWFVKYSADNTEKQDDFVIEQLHKLHGAGVKYDEEKEQMIWPLSNTRSVHAQYVAPDNLCILYHDSEFEKLFTLPTSEGFK